MAKEKKFITCEGNYAASHIAYMFSEVACIYPITPSSDMAEYVDTWAAHGRKNIFGDTVDVREMQSEGGAAGAVHGSLQAGALTSTYTASQGLLLMIPNMYKIAGELLPGVFHVSARTVASHALSIFGDHSDVMATRQTGFALLATSGVQEVMDLAGVAHLTAIKTRIPFVHFFDGFRTSHEIQKVELMEMEDLQPLVDYEALQGFRESALNPENPVTRGSAQNPDVFFQAREAINPFYETIPDTVEEYMREIEKITGREYHPFNYYGHPEAENIIVAMGSVTPTIEETVDYLIEKGEKVGLIIVHLYRPFSEKYFMKVLPKTVQKITVLDRTKEPGANGEPMYLDVRDLFYGKENAPVIVGGRYGLSSKDTVPTDILAVFNNMKEENPKNHFTISIVDDVTFLSLDKPETISLAPKSMYAAKFYGLGSDGTVGANKNSIKIIGGATNKYVQAYFAYDSKKSGGITISHLRSSDEPIRSTYLVGAPDFVACHVPAYLNKYDDMLKGIKQGGNFLLNSVWDAEETLNRIPDHYKKIIAEKELNVYIINATKIAKEIGLGNRTNTIMQSAFFYVSDIIPYELAKAEMKAAIKKSYGRKGDKIVNMNNEAVDQGTAVTKLAIPASWKDIADDLSVYDKLDKDAPDYVKNIADTINRLKGDSLPVSAFLSIEDGSMPAGTAAYEKRGVAVEVPEWDADSCIQCNLCAAACPHGVIRPFLLDENEVANMPEGTKTITAKPAKQFNGLEFRITTSIMDCTGCGVCVQVCPSKPKSLKMMPLETQLQEATVWEYMDKHVGYKEDVVPKDKNVKNSQFAQPLFEFSGACAGCGETPYIKMVTQLYGENMMIANATGCSSIYGASAPSTPYTAHKESGKGPAWANSLFEDNAEFGFGMAVANAKLRNRLGKMLEENKASFKTGTQTLIDEWFASKNDTNANQEPSKKLIEALAYEDNDTAREVLKLRNYLSKKSNWIIGGDGWAYDIGYGGLDHVIASGENVNILVLDTEVYSNTGGQSSKSTPIGAVAKFAASGKKIRKKDLGAIATTYGYVYVAQVAQGASSNHMFKIMKEAESYDGPSLVIAYSPCIAHGIKAGMNNTMDEEKRAVEAGYWALWHYDPRKEAEGKNPFSLDSKEPDFSKFRDYLLGEVRFASLLKSFPDEAEELFAAAEEAAKWRYNYYKRMDALEY